jgi:hypothetical protein
MEHHGTWPSFIILRGQYVSMLTGHVHPCSIAILNCWRVLKKECVITNANGSPKETPPFFGD